MQSSSVRSAGGAVAVSLLTMLVFLSLQDRISADEAAASSSLNSRVFESHVRFLAADERFGRMPGSDGSATAAEYIVRHFKAFGLTPLQSHNTWFQEFPLGSDCVARNILAVSPGAGSLSSEAIIVTGHYDHIGVSSTVSSSDDDQIFNGADDNASGVAILLMVAQQFSQHPVSRMENRRTVIFASFDAEERGLLGARHYASHPLWPLDKTVAVINFDGSGRMRQKKFFASDAETNAILSQVIRESAARAGLEVETRFGGHGRSDHAVFAERGIPGVHFLTGAHSDYHQVTDETERLNFDGGAAISQIGFDTLERLATYPEKLVFRRLRLEFDVEFALNLARMIGIVPVVNAQEGRYPQILFVIPESIADRLGLRSGDQITALDGTKFGRVEDFGDILQNLRFQDGITVSILRDGKDTAIQIPSVLIAQLRGPVSSPVDNNLFEVTFRHKPAAKSIQSVFLAGEFNNWNPRATKMTGPDDSGYFTGRVTLTQGFHEYKFVEEGTEWKSDPLNMHRTGYYQNSVVWVGPQ